MEITVLKHPTKEDWLAVKQRALVTAGFSSVKNPPDDEWKRKMLRCKHSPIRYLQFSFFIKDMPYWLSTEMSRHHIGYEKYIKSQRNDRQENYDRNSARQDAPVNMIIDCNAESFMTVFAKRSCGVATKEAQEVMLKLKELVIKTNPEFEEFLVPPCCSGRCTEFNPCGKKALYFNKQIMSKEV